MVRWTDHRPAERGCRVDPAPRQVEHVARPEDLVDGRVALRLPLHGGAMVGPRLVAQGLPVHRRVDPPVLLPRDLQNEDIVHVVVRIESAGGGWGDVRVHLGGMAEVIDELPGEVGQRRPGAVQPLEHQGGAAGEFVEHLVGTDLVGDLGAEAARCRVAAGVEHCALPRHAHERGAQSTVGHKFVDRLSGEQVIEAPRQFGSASEERLPVPVLGGKGIR